MTRRAQQAAIAARLRTEGEGLGIAAIAREMGISVSYAGELLADPTGEKARARKRKYLKRCKVCGQLCWGTHCKKHAEPNVGKRSAWTQAMIIEAMQEWEVIHHHPPTVTEWLRRKGLPDWCPTAGSVYKVFGEGGWNKAIVAAGFTPRRIGFPEWVVQEQAGNVSKMSPEKRQEQAELFRQRYAEDPDHPRFRGLREGWDIARQERERRDRRFRAKQAAKRTE